METIEKTKTKRAKREVEKTVPVTAEDLLKEKAEQWIAANKAANEQQAKAAKLRKELFALLEDNNVSSIEGLVYVAAEDTTEIDPAAFSKLVSPSDFWSSVKVSKANAAKLLPGATIDSISVIKAGMRNVHKVK